MKMLIALLVTLTALPSFANLEVAGIASYSQRSFETGDGLGSMNSSTTPSIGALLLLPLFPGLSLRTGLIHAERSSKDNDMGSGVKGEVKDTLTNIPLNIQVGLPATDAYLFGGMIFAQTQESTCSLSSGSCAVTDKTPNDTEINLGVGYDFWTMALLRFAGELEYTKGTKNLATGATGSIKDSTIGLNLVFAFGF